MTLSNYDFNSFDKLHDFIDEREGFNSILNPKNRFKILLDFIKVDYSFLLVDLAMSWYLSGFSPENGLFPAKPIRVDETFELEFYCGSIPESISRSYLLELNDISFVIQYGKGQMTSSSTDKVIWTLKNSLVSN